MNVQIPRWITFSIFFGIPTLVSIVWWHFGPMPFRYQQYVRDVRGTPDEIVFHVACDDVELQVFHTDEAHKGSHGSIDSEMTPPYILHHYYLQALEDGKILFSKDNNYQEDDHLNGLVVSRHLIPASESTQKIFVVDPNIYRIMTDPKRFEMKAATSRDSKPDARVIAFGPNQFSNEMVSSLVDCYKKHARELNDAAQWPVAAFVEVKGDPRLLW